jgi:RimJ/RimL family protein N-acetyltransferase
LLEADGPQLQTARLLLRRWRERDLEPFAQLNADPEVMEHFPATLSRGQSDELVARIERGFERDGFGFWAVELREERSLAGFVGLGFVRDRMPFAPAVEIGWRLGREHWGKGIASEAALAARDHGFQTAGLVQIVAYTTARNERSRRVMTRIGMHHDPSGDFVHPAIDAADPTAPHVLYRVDRSPQ